MRVIPTRRNGSIGLGERVRAAFTRNGPTPAHNVARGTVQCNNITHVNEVCLVFYRVFFALSETNESFIRHERFGVTPPDRHARSTGSSRPSHLIGRIQSKKQTCVNGNYNRPSSTTDSVRVSSDSRAHGERNSLYARPKRLRHNFFFL